MKAILTPFLLLNVVIGIATPVWGFTIIGNPIHHHHHHHHGHHHQQRLQHNQSQRSNDTALNGIVSRFRKWRQNRKNRKNDIVDDVETVTVAEPMSLAGEEEKPEEPSVHGEQKDEEEAEDQVVEEKETLVEEEPTPESEPTAQPEPLPVMESAPIQEEDPAPSASLSPDTIDDLFLQGKPDEARQILEDATQMETTKTDADLYWRYVKSFYESFGQTPESNETDREAFLRQGLDLAEDGLANLHPNNGYLLKWRAVLLGKLGSFQSTKEKMSNSFRIREDLEQAAIQLPGDGSIQQALGEWCFKVAGISFMERQVASVLFGTPPSASYDDALAYFEKAHDLKQNSETASKVAETLQKLGRKADAKEWNNKATTLKD